MFFDAHDQRDVTAPRAIGEATKIFAVLVLLEHAQKRTRRGLYLLGNRFVVRLDKVRCTRLSPQCRSALPSVVISNDFATCELLPRAINTLKPESHLSVSSKSQGSLLG